MKENPKRIDSLGRAKAGLQSAKARIMLRGLAAVDKRCTNARRLLGFRADLVAALGGADALTPQLECLIELIVRTQAVIDHADGFLLFEPRLINTRKRTFFPIVLQRQRLVDSQAQLLSQVGLQRRAKPVQSLQEFLASKEAHEIEENEP